MRLRIGFTIGIATAGSVFLSPLLAYATPPVTNITSCDDLQLINANLAGNYVLKNDIDCGYDLMLPLGALSGGADVEPFTGTFNGNNHIIYDLDIENDAHHEFIGLFGLTDGATITNLRLSDVRSMADDKAGALIGEARNTTVNNVGIEYAAVFTDFDKAGGMIGSAIDTIVRRSYVAYSTISASYPSAGGFAGYWDASSGSDLYVQGTDVNGSDTDVGGLIGTFTSTDGPSSLINSYADADIRTSSLGGGLIGHMQEGDTCTVANSFATGTSATPFSNIGGLVGQKESGCQILNSAYDYQLFISPSMCVYDDQNVLTTECDQIANDTAYFYNPLHAPLNSWNTYSVWYIPGLDLPTLLWLPPSAPTNASATLSGSGVTLTWTNPTDSDFASVTIRRSTTGFPTSADDGTAVVSGQTGTSYTDTSAHADGSYYYSIFAEDTSGSFSATAAEAATVIDTAPAAANVCSLHAYLPFDALGSSPVAADTSGNGFDGSLFSTGTPALSSDVPTSGIPSDTKSYLFTASDNDGIKLSRPAQGDFTMCLWFKTTTAGTGTHHYDARMLLDSEAPGLDYDFGFGLSGDNHLIFGDGDTGADYAVKGTSTVNTGNWTHACVTRQLSTGFMRIFVNGEAEAASIGSTHSLYANSHLVIGAPQDGGSYWNGNIDDVRIYDSVLNNAEIRSLANGSAACLVPVVSSGSSSSSAPDTAPVQSSGGHRGNSTHMIVQTLEIRSAETNTVHPSATVASSASVSPRETMSEALQIRTCKRVEKWFSGNAVMIDRVNARLEKRFGFECSL